MTTTPFQEAGGRLADLSIHFSTIWGSRNLPEANVARAQAARRAVHAYIRGGDAQATLRTYGFEVDK